MGLHMTRLERLQEKLAKAEQELHLQVYKGNLLNLQKYQQRVDDIKKEIHEAQLYSPQRLGNIVPKEDLLNNNIYEKLLEIIIGADYLYDTAFDCKCALSKVGVEGFQIYDMVSKINKLASDIAASIIIDDVGDLEKFVVEDDEFVEATHVNAVNYIRNNIYLHPPKEEPKIPPLLRHRKPISK
jgi:hypothetical protein